MPALIRATLLPAENDAGGASPRSQAARYLAETAPSPPCYGRLYKPLERLLLLGTSRAPKAPLATEPAAIEAPASPLDEHMCWADGLAILYGGLHRSFVMLRYLLLLPTVLGACVAFYLPVTGAAKTLAKAAGFGPQAGSLASILTISKLNRRRDWRASRTPA